MVSLFLHPTAIYLGPLKGQAPYSAGRRKIWMDENDMVLNPVEGTIWWRSHEINK